MDLHGVAWLALFQLLGTAIDQRVVLIVPRPIIGLLSMLGVETSTARGMTLGLMAHAVSASVTIQEGEEWGAFAGLAMS